MFNKAYILWRKGTCRNPNTIWYAYLDSDGKLQTSVTRRC